MTPSMGVSSILPPPIVTELIIAATMDMYELAFSLGGVAVMECGASLNQHANVSYFND